MVEGVYVGFMSVAVLYLETTWDYQSVMHIGQKMRDATTGHTWHAPAVRVTSTRATERANSVLINLQGDACHVPRCQTKCQQCACVMQQ